MKRQVERAAYSLRKHSKDPIVRGRYFTIKKTFKKLVRKKEYEFRNNVLNQISQMESNNPNKFWEMANELRTAKRNNYIDNIEPKKWYSWLRELNTEKKSVGNNEFDKGVKFIIKSL